MRSVFAAALAVTLTVGAADAMQQFNAVKSFILGGRNSGNHTVIVPTPVPVPTPTPTPPPPSADCAAIQADFSDATGCNAALLAGILLL